MKHREREREGGRRLLKSTELKEKAKKKTVKRKNRKIGFRFEKDGKKERGFTNCKLCSALAFFLQTVAVPFLGVPYCLNFLQPIQN